MGFKVVNGGKTIWKLVQPKVSLHSKENTSTNKKNILKAESLLAIPTLICPQMSTLIQSKYHQRMYDVNINDIIGKKKCHYNFIARLSSCVVFIF